MANDDDIVQNFRVEGVEDAAEQVKSFGDSTASSFKKIDDQVATTTTKLGALKEQFDALGNYQGPVNAVAASAKRAGITPEEFQQRTEQFKRGYTRDQVGNVTSPAESAAPEPDDGGGEPPNKPPKQKPEDAGIDVAREALDKFREAIHVLHPALSEAGISTGVLGGLLRAASGGIVALAAAIGGTLVVAMEKAADEANDAASRISAFKDSAADGKRTFQELTEVSDKLRVPTTSISGSYEQILRANQSEPEGKRSSENDILSALSTILKGGIGENRNDPEKAISAVTSMLASIKESGTLTPEAVKAAQEVIPQTVAAILKQLPQGRAATSSDVTSAINRSGPEIEKNVADTTKNFESGIGEAWGYLKTASDKLAEATSGGHVVADTLEGISHLLDLFSGAVKKLREHPLIMAGLKTGLKTATLPLAMQAYDAYKNSTSTETPAGAAFNKNAANNPLTSNRDTGVSENVIAPSDRVKTAFNALAVSTGNTQKTLDAFALAQGNAAKALTAVDTRKQAGIDLAFEPDLTRNKLEKEQLAVTNADIHLENAKLSGIEAIKNLAESRLAPETARENLIDANSNYGKALSKFFQGRGVDTSALDQVNQGQDEINALNRARTAKRRAEIEDKYAYLEPKKAELAAQQSETEIRSAEIEKSDALLTLAKDAQGAPLSHELAQLKYSQAQLDETKALGTVGNKQLDVLQEIAGLMQGENKAKADSNHAPVAKDIIPAAASLAAPHHQNLDPHQINVPGSPFGPSGTQTDPHQISVNPISENTSALKENTTATTSNTSQAKENVVAPNDRVKMATKREADVTPIGEPGDGFMHEPRKDFGDQRDGIYDPGPYSHNKNDPWDKSAGWNARHGSGIGDGVGQTPTFDTEKVPLPEPRPSEAQPRAEAQPDQQFASLMDKIGEIVSTVSSKLAQPDNPDKLQNGDQPVDNMGVRGEAAPSTDDAVVSLSSSLSDAASSASSFADKLASLSVPTSSNDNAPVHAAAGGHITGEGTETSDSINARLSHNEFVQPAAAVNHYGLDFMQAVQTRTLPRFSVGGLFKNFARAMAPALPSFAGGGHVQVASHALGDLSNFGTVDLRTNHGEHQVITQRDTMRHLSSAAASAKSFSTGPKPGWYGGAAR